MVLLVVVIVLVSGGSRLSSAGFLIAPSSINATVNSTVNFMCQADSPASYSWIVNGRLLDRDRPPPGVSFSEDTNGVRILSIFSDESRNMSTVVCRVIPLDDTVLRSDEAILLIQGRLGPVTNITVNSTSTSITLSWVPPFSLDITEVYPDFTHTVRVFNTTNGSRELIVTCPNIPVSTFTLALNGSRYLEGTESCDFNSQSSPRFDPSNLLEFCVVAVDPRGVEGEACDPVKGHFLGDKVTMCIQEASTMTTTSTDRGDNYDGQTTASDSVSQSERTTFIISLTIVAFVVGTLLGSVITLIIVMIINCLRKPAQQSIALETESGEIEMKSCDAYNVVAKKQKTANNQPPPMYEEIDI